MGFKQSMGGDAVLYPSPTGLRAAGDDWVPEEVPLFACLVMSKPSRDGTGQMVTPFFLDPMDGKLNLENAVANIQKAQGDAKLTEEQQSYLQLVCTSLEKAVELVLTDKEMETCGDERFEFVPPSRSIAYLQAANEEYARRKDERRSGALEDAAKNDAPQGGGSDGLFPE